MATMYTHIEYKTADGRWVHYAAPRVNPDYRLFALIADVHNDENGIDPIVPPRGLPADMSEVTQISYNENKEHCYTIYGKTWLSADEFMELQIRWNDLNPDLSWIDTDFEYAVFNTFGPCHSSIAHHRGFTDARIIFWFDY